MLVVTMGFDAPGLTVAIERRRSPVDAHDQADASLQMLVGETYALADAEVGTIRDLRRRSGRGLALVLRLRPRRHSTPSARWPHRAA
jgi:hypothetical protein